MRNHPIRPIACILASLTGLLASACSTAETEASVDPLRGTEAIECYEEGDCDPDEGQFCNHDPATDGCEPVSCADGKQNCDGIGGCECEAGCGADGACLDLACTNAVASECGDETQWCYTRHARGTPGCQTCSDLVHPEALNPELRSVGLDPNVAVRGPDGHLDYLNCDGVDGCEYECPRGYGPCTCPTTTLGTDGGTP